MWLHTHEGILAPAGLPGNDDQAAMATVLIWHLLGLYPRTCCNFDTIKSINNADEKNTTTNSSQYIRDADSLSLHAQIHHSQRIPQY